MFASAARQGQAADSTVMNDAEASDEEDDTRSRAELQPRLSGDEVGPLEANGTESSEVDEVCSTTILCVHQLLTHFAASSQSDSSDAGTSSSAETSDEDDDEDDREEGDANNEEQDEFDRELARMMAESGREARSAAPAKRNIFNERTLPTLKRQPASSHAEEEDSHNMKFTLLMKKGSKQQVSLLNAFVQGSDVVLTDFVLDTVNGSTSRVGACYAHADEAAAGERGTAAIETARAEVREAGRS